MKEDPEAKKTGKKKRGKKNGEKKKREKREKKFQQQAASDNRWNHYCKSSILDIIVPEAVNEHWQTNLLRPCTVCNILYIHGIKLFGKEIPDLHIFQLPRKSWIFFVLIKCFDG